MQSIELNSGSGTQNGHYKITMSYSDTSDTGDSFKLLNRCSPKAREAVSRYHEKQEPHEVKTIVNEVISHYVAEEQLPSMKHRSAKIRLREDLGLDSLSMIEICMTLEEVFGITLTESELRDLHTVGDVNRFTTRRLSS